MIRSVTKNELPDCLEVIHKSFATVAEEFGLTMDNCPGHTSFMKLEKLQSQYDYGCRMFGYYHGDQLIGFFGLSKAEENIYELHHLAVLPEYRHNGYGREMLGFAKRIEAEWGGNKIKIGIIDESTKLKKWYMANGFKVTGIHRYAHLPFTVGYMECDI